MSGSDIELPELLSGSRIKGREESTHSILAAACTNNHATAFDHAGRHGEGVGQILGCDTRLPEDLAGLHVEGSQTPVEYGRDHFAFVQRQTAIDDAAASRRAAISLRVREQEWLSARI